MNDYGFKLEWDELDEELRERKIDKQIEYCFDNGEYDEDLGLGECLADERIRNGEEYVLSRYFPIYF